MLAHFLVFETEMTLDEAARTLAVSNKSTLDASGVKSRPRLMVIDPKLSPDGGGPAPSVDDGWTAIADRLNAEVKGRG